MRFELLSVVRRGKAARSPYQGFIRQTLEGAPKGSSRDGGPWRS
jgi:hypothetical protein